MKCPAVLLSLLMFLLMIPVAGEGSEALQSSGDLLAVLLPASAGTATLALGDYDGSKQLIMSTALSLGTTLALKYAVNERRPDGEDYSFPSGHAALSFSSAEFVRKRYGLEYGLPAYLAAGFVGFTRVESKQHYFHDVLAGALIGIGSSYLFTTPHGRLQVSGEAGAGYAGIRLAGNW